MMQNGCLVNMVFALDPKSKSVTQRLWCICKVFFVCLLSFVYHFRISTPRGQNLIFFLASV